MEEPIETRGLTRGGLIKAGAAAALVVGAGGAGRALADVAGAPLAVSGLAKPEGGPFYLQHQTFLPLVGSDFRIVLPDASTLRMKLTDVTRLPSPGEAFSLLFRARPRLGVSGGIYRVEHPALRKFELFMGPVGRGVKSLDLEAVINRIAT